MGNDISGLADPDYAAGRGRARRRRRRHPHPPRPRGSPIPTRTTTTSWPTWPRFLAERAGARPRPPASPPSGSCSTPASTSARRPSSRSTLLRASPTLAALGYPLLLSASNKTFLGKILDLELTERREASIGAAALGIAWGCRIVRVHDVKGTCRVRDVAGRGQRGRVSTRAAAAASIWSRVTTPRWWPRRCAACSPSVVGDGDHALVVEEIGGGAGDDLNVGAVVDACLTPPFLVDRRVVVVREAGRLLTADVPRLVEVVRGPAPDDGARPGRRGRDGPGAAGQGGHGRRARSSTSRRARRGTARRGCTTTCGRRRSSSSRGAADLLAGHVGEDLGRVEGLLGALSAAYGEGARVTADDLAPYLGEAGNVPRYELTDAIDRGEPGRALAVLHRMLEAGGLAPVQVLATLHGHFANMLVLDGDDVRQRARRRGRARHGALRGQEGARAVTAPRQHEDRRGHQPDRGGRPRRARGERPRRRAW